MNGLLMRTPAPFSDESPRSYLTRLAEANGYDSVSPILEMLKDGKAHQITSGWEYSKLSGILGPMCSLPQGFGYRAAGKQMREEGRLLGRPVQTRHLGLHKARICPQCIQEKGYVYAAWDLKAYLACPIHGILLLKHCPSCARRITHTRPGLLQCLCGESFLGADLRLASPAMLGFCGVLHHLAAGNEGCLDMAWLAGMPVQEFRRMELNVFLRMTVTIATVLQAINEWTGGPRAYEELVEVLPDTCQVFCDWPRNFELLCVKWQQSPSMRARDDGFQARFDWLFARLNKNLKEKGEQTRFLREVACGYATRRWDARPFQLRSKEKQVLRLPDARYGSAVAAASLLGINAITAARWASSGRIPATRCGKGHNRNWCIDLDAVRAMRFSAYRGVSEKVAKTELGVSVASLKTLIKLGYLASNHFVVGRQGLIALEDLDRLKERLLDACVPKPAGIAVQPLKAALKGRPALQVSLIGQILEGAEAAYIDSGGYFDDIQVAEPPPKVRPLRAKKQNRSGVGRGTHITRSLAEARYNLLSYEASAVFRSVGARRLSRGLLTAKASAVEEFFKKHLTVRRIAAEQGIHSIQLLRALRRLNNRALVGLSSGWGPGDHRAWFVPAAYESFARGLAARLRKDLDIDPARGAHAKRMSEGRG